jgi:tRNA pseudouridine13 synthase
LAYPYLTADLPGVGGQIKAQDDDFRVVEIPLYAASGEGEHTYARVEKRGLSTFEAVRRISGALGINPREVGYAGLKDAHAVTVQWLSLGDVPPALVERLDLSGIRVLEVGRHTNKLRVGHLAGNHFTIRVRDLPASSLPAAQAILDQLAVRGVPNYYGEQRFGLRGDTHLLGRALVCQDIDALIRRLVGMPHPAESPRVRQARQLFEEGDLEGAVRAWPRQMDAERSVVRALAQGQTPAAAVRRLPSRMRRFYVSAYQSSLFNRVLARRIERGILGRLLLGDLAYLHGRGAVFSVDDPQAEQPRADRFEISPSGPLYGRKLSMPSGLPGEMEQRVLDEEGLALEDWRVRGLKLKGARRALRIPLRDVESSYDGGLQLCFSLPPGCYATVVLRELQKADVDPALP